MTCESEACANREVWDDPSGTREGEEAKCTLERSAETEDEDDESKLPKPAKKKRKTYPRKPCAFFGQLSGAGYSSTHLAPPQHLCSRCGWTGHNVRSCQEEWAQVLAFGLSGLTIDTFREQGAERIRRRNAERRIKIARKARAWYHRNRGTSLLQQFGLV
jgi:hypothetical protein